MSGINERQGIVKCSCIEILSNDPEEDGAYFTIYNQCFKRIGYLNLKEYFFWGGSHHQVLNISPIYTERLNPFLEDIYVLSCSECGALYGKGSELFELNLLYIKRLIQENKYDFGESQWWLHEWYR